MKVIKTICILLCAAALVGAAGKALPKLIGGATADLAPANRSAAPDIAGPDIYGLAPTKAPSGPGSPPTDDSLWTIESTLPIGTVLPSGSWMGTKVYGDTIYQMANITSVAYKVYKFNRLTGAKFDSIVGHEVGYGVGISKVGDSLYVCLYSPSSHMDVYHIPTRTYVRSMTPGITCRGLDWDGTRFWVVNDAGTSNVPINWVSRAGVVLKTLTPTGATLPYWGFDMTLDRSIPNRLWMCDQQNNRVDYCSFDTVGNTYSILTTFAHPGGAYPEGIGFFGPDAAGGHVYTSQSAGAVLWKMLVHQTPYVTDMAVSSIVQPQTMCAPGSVVTPSCVITNIGTGPMSNIPVACLIDSAGVNRYTSTPYTYVGPLAAGASAPVTFANTWTVGPANATYNVKTFVSAAVDSNRTNDTARRTVTAMPPPNRVFDPEWDLATGYNALGAGLYGVAGVQDSLIWVTRGYLLPFKIIIYRASDLTVKDSFTAAYQGGSYGYRDMYWDRGENVVYAGADANRLDKINTTAPYSLIATYTLTGTTLPGTVRALTGDGDSLYTAGFGVAKIKFSKTGTNCHQVAPSSPSTYGLALDRTKNIMYMTNASGVAPEHLIEYSFPAWTQTLDTVIPATNIAGNGGCEMFGHDTFLLIAEQTPGAIVHCVRVIPLGTDVGVDLVESPTGFITPGTYQPKVRIKNYGANAQPSFPAVLTITGGYTSTMSVPALNPGDTAQVTFGDWTPSGSGVYTLRCTTQLTGDMRTRNDAKEGIALIPTFTEDFEATDGGFTVSGPTANWTWGVPGSPRPAAHSGTKVWGAALTGTYPASMNTQLNSSPLVALQNNPIVAFYQWYYFETSYDGGNCRYSTDNGVTWALATPMATLGAVYNGTGNTANPLSGQPIFTGGPTSGWQLVAYQVPVPTSTEFKVRWIAASDPSVQYNGWVIDDVAGIGCRPPLKDVGIVSIVRPNATEIPGTTGVPVQIRVHNYGEVAATFDIRAIIPNALGSDTLRTGKLAQTLAPGGEQVYLMDDLWDISAIPTIYPMRCSTVYAPDQVPDNDKAQKFILTGTTDAEVSAIIAPTGSNDTFTTITPSAKVKNNGTVAYPFEVFFWFDSTGATTHSYYQTQTVTIPSGDSAVVVFPDWVKPYQVQSYASKCSVYVPNDGTPGNDVATGTFDVIPGLLDYAVEQILYPAGVVDTLTPVLPSARIRNVGTAPRLAQVHFTIDDRTGDAVVYEESVAVTVPGGETFDAVLPEWPFPHLPLWFNTHCWLTLPGDADPTNDSKNDSFQVVLGTVDYGVTAIVGPSGTYYDTMVAVIPSATIFNFGTINPTVKVYFTIDDGTAAIIYADTLTISDLLPGSPRTVSFDEWLPIPHPLGAYATHCWVAIIGDVDPTNDSKTGAFSFEIRPPTPVWEAMTSLPTGGANKNVKDGGALAYGEETGNDTGFVYAFKGNNRYEFYRYNTLSNAWISRESIPAIGSSTKKKAVKKGSTLVMAANNKVYGAKGNGTLEWWQFDPVANSWTEKASVLSGAKALKEGVGSAAVTVGSDNYVYLLRGSGTWDFMRYNVGTDAWETRAPAPGGTSTKPYKNGSTICYDGGDTIYALKGSYNEFFAYSISGDNWVSRDPLPLIGSSLKKKKVKDGAGMAYAGGTVYALKGGNTNEFFTYNTVTHVWVTSTDMPTVTKRVKAGGALVAAEAVGSLYAFRGNNTLEFWKFGPVVFSAFSAPNTPKSVMNAGVEVVSRYKLQVTPNPFVRVANVSYAVPKSGNVSLRLYDVTGKLVTTLANGYTTAGNHNAPVNAEKLASGIYLLKFESDNYTTTSKLIIE